MKYFIRFSLFGSSLCLYYLYFGRWVIVNHMWQINNWLLTSFKVLEFPFLDALLLLWCQLIFRIALIQIFMLVSK